MTLDLAFAVKVFTALFAIMNPIANIPVFLSLTEGSSDGERRRIAEVTLIGLVAGVLGACAGLYYAAMAGAVEKMVVGIPNRYLAEDVGTMSWLIGGHLLVAVGLTTLLAWLAAVVPAARGACAAQRVLLAAGRS